MKKDIDFLKDMLVHIENRESAFFTTEGLMIELALSNSDIERLYHHIELLKDVNAISLHNPSETSFMEIVTLASFSLLAGNSLHRLTNDGHNLILAFKNESIWHKLQSFGGNITTPALIKAGEKITDMGLDNLLG